VVTKIVAWDLRGGHRKDPQSGKLVPGGEKLHCDAASLSKQRANHATSRSKVKVKLSLCSP
jgi:hypothetical protein